jgi:ribosome-associated protein
MNRKLTKELLSSEIAFTTSRSSGPGGQNVNKVNSKVTLKFDVINSTLLTDEEREMLSSKLSRHLTKEGVLLLTAQEKRSQLENKGAVLLKLERLLAKAFEKKKIRKSTKPTKSAVQKRIKSKKETSEKKKWRQKLSDD